MNTYIVTRKADGAQVDSFSAEAPIEWQGMEFAAFDHVDQREPATVEKTFCNKHTRSKRGHTQ